MGDYPPTVVLGATHLAAIAAGALATLLWVTRDRVYRAAWRAGWDERGAWCDRLNRRDHAHRPGRRAARRPGWGRGRGRDRDRDRRWCP